MQRLAVHIHLAFVGMLLVFAVLASLLWWAAPARQENSQLHRAAGALAARLVPDGDEPLGPLREALAESAESMRATLFSPNGSLLDAIGAPLPWPGETAGARGFALVSEVGHVAVVSLPDGRLLAVRAGPRRPPGHAWVALLAALVIAMAAGAYPLARRITRRLEHLRHQVDALGEGDLTARVAVDGRDEVAVLADHFNRAAARIERLVGAQKQALANASHELRSPLARLRMGLELLPGDARPEIRARMSRDIEELDDLIGDVLLASRLDAGAAGPLEEIELLALVAEESARCASEVTVEGDPATVCGDVRSLHRLVRNLLENARRYGHDGDGAPRIEARVRPRGDAGAVITICDRGPGVPDAERERIFEPFYRPAGLREDGDGVGLGLSLVRQIARQHGGEVRCLARDGGGSCFEVVLAAVHTSSRTAHNGERSPA